MDKIMENKNKVSGEYFEKLGLSKYKSAALMGVLKNQNITALDLSKISKIPHTKIYTVLESLQNMGFVYSTVERPKKYFAIKPEKIVDRLIRKYDRKAEMIRRFAEEALVVINKA